MGELTEQDVARFWPKVELLQGPDACWLWTACRLFRDSGLDGYGVFQLGGAPIGAHRVAYTILVGPIPEGLTIDHLCRNTACVNLAHLEAVTQWENTRRGLSPQAVNAKKTHCVRGHAFRGENLRRDSRGRVCKTCRRIRDKERYYRLKGAIDV